MRVERLHGQESSTSGRQLMPASDVKLRSALSTDPPRLQNSIRDSFSARSHCAGLSVCGQVFLLNLNQKGELL
jgi:hypothetical protein